MPAFLWTQRQDIGPGPRHGHGMAYDVQGGRTLLVGGDGTGELFGDTWLWDGQTWTQVQDIGASKRSGHAVAYDSARQRVVLFGGRDGAGALGDTWEWDGQAWTQVEDTGPGPRSRHSLAYDYARSRVVLFGGEATLGPLGDTWEWDGDKWTQVADTGPGPRAGHAVCYETTEARTVLFGGAAVSDTWAWDGTLWTQLNDVGPPPCSGTALVWTGQSTILFGGIDQSTGSAVTHRSTWELTGSDWTHRQDMGPAARHGHAMAYDTTRRAVVLFGGSGAATATIADLYGDTWELPAGTGDGGGGENVELGSFTVTPDVVGSDDAFVIEVGLDQPAPAPVDVNVDLAGTASFTMTIDAGATGAGAELRPVDFGLAPGIGYELYATLGDVTLEAIITVIIKLVEFTVTPAAVGLGEQFGVRVRIDTPAPAPLDVVIDIAGLDQVTMTIDTGAQDRIAWMFPTDHGIASGGTYTLTATLEGVTLTASVTVT